MTAPTRPAFTAYIPNPTHRGIQGNAHKSQWTITVIAEQQVFSGALMAGWVDQANHVWGLHIIGGQAQNLGTPSSNAPHTELLFIGKFLDDGQGVWHGYPADHRTNGKRDIPPSNVRKDWLAGKFVKKSVVTKLSQGRACAL